MNASDMITVEEGFQIMEHNWKCLLKHQYLLVKLTVEMWPADKREAARKMAEDIAQRSIVKAMRELVDGVPEQHREALCDRLHKVTQEWQPPTD